MATSATSSLSEDDANIEENGMQNDLTALLELFGEEERQLITEGLKLFVDSADRRQRTADWLVATLANNATVISSTADQTTEQNSEIRTNGDEPNGDEVQNHEQAPTLEAVISKSAAVFSTLASTSTSNDTRENDDASPPKKRIRHEPPMTELDEEAKSRTPALNIPEPTADLDNGAHSPTAILKKVELIVASCPDIGADALYARLEACDSLEGTTTAIVNSYREGVPHATADATVVPHREDSGANVHNADAILRTVGRIIAQCPDMNADAVYARLHRSNSLGTTAAEIVRDYIPVEERPGPSGLNSCPSHPMIPPEMKAFVTCEVRDEFTHIMHMFPDADAIKVLEERIQSDLSKEEFVNRMIRVGYAKNKDRVAKERKERRRNALLNAFSATDIAEFLKIFGDPEAYFTDVKRTVSQIYVKHATVYLMNFFKTLTAEYISALLDDHGNHFLPAIRTLEAQVQNGDNERYGTEVEWLMSDGLSNLALLFWNDCIAFMALLRLDDLPWPQEVDEQFFRELQYHHCYDQIRVLQDEQRQQRERELLAARTAGNLEECPICADDECLTADMLQCTDDEKLHRFCRNCVRQHADQRISDGAHRVACMDGGCECEYPTDTLRLLLRPQQVNMLLRRMTREQLLAANLQGMQECPFCDFAIIIENDQERVFRCQNQECLKESCRECKAENHVPLRCAEVENDAELAMRKDVELAMSNALIRTCPNCQKQLIKSDGCNKLMCPCGTAICYLCRQALPPNDPYGHFDGGNGCRLDTSMQKVHADVAAAAGEAAKRKWLGDERLLRKVVDVEQLVDRDERDADYDEDEEEMDEDDEDEEEADLLPLDVLMPRPFAQLTDNELRLMLERNERERARLQAEMQRRRAQQQVRNAAAGLFHDYQ